MTYKEYNCIKINDIVICVNNLGLKIYLTLNKHYTINGKNSLFSTLSMVNENKDICEFNYTLFELLSKIRIEKLNKLMK